MNMLRQRIELGWHVIALTLLSGAFIPLWRQETLGDAIVTSGDPFQQVVLLFSYSGVLLLWWHRQQAMRVALRGWLIWIIIGWAILSVFWSQVPALTIRRSAILVLATLYGLLLAIRYPPATVLRLIGSAMAIIVVSSLIAIGLGAPGAIMGYPHPGAWRGIMYHKNALGRICVLALIVFGVLMYQTTMPWRIGWGVLIAGCAGLIVGAQSATAVVILVIIILAWMVLIPFSMASRREQVQTTMIGLGIAAPTGYLLWSYSEDIAQLLNRDLTLTGRLPLWQALLPIGWKQALTGYGFGAFWTDPSRMMDVDIALMRLRFWWAVQAHNGYIDVWLELGIVGVCMVSALLIFIVQYSTLCIRTNQVNNKYFIHFLFLLAIFLITYNLTEAVLLETQLANAIFWIIPSWSYFVIQKNKRVER